MPLDNVQAHPGECSALAHVVNKLPISIHSLLLGALVIIKLTFYLSALGLKYLLSAVEINIVIETYLMPAKVFSDISDPYQWTYSHDLWNWNWLDCPTFNESDGIYTGQSQVWFGYPLAERTSLERDAVERTQKSATISAQYITLCVWPQRRLVEGMGVALPPRGWGVERGKFFIFLKFSSKNGAKFHLFWNVPAPNRSWVRKMRSNGTCALVGALNWPLRSVGVCAVVSWAVMSCALVATRSTGYAQVSCA